MFNYEFQAIKPLGLLHPSAPRCASKLISFGSFVLGLFGSNIPSLLMYNILLSKSRRFKQNVWRLYISKDFFSSGDSLLSCLTLPWRDTGGD